MKIIDWLCKALGLLSATLFAGGMLYVCAYMGFGDGHIIPPPRAMFIGMLGIMSAMIIYGAIHLINGDLFD